MPDPLEPDLFDFRPPLTARREAVRQGPLAKVAGRAWPGMPARARAKHFSLKGSKPGVRTPRSAAGGQRRVMVKARVVRMTPSAKKALMTHVRYVEREGAGVQGEAGSFFDRTGDQADARAFAERCVGDRHHFRLIVNPEDGRDLPDLKAYGRDLMAQVERDMGTSVDWVAGAHYDTGRPHLHILIRGKRDDGRDLVLPRDYVSHGIRQRAQELATEILGPRLEQASDRSLTADRFTPMDRELISAAAPDGRLTLESLPEEMGSDALRRLVHLESRGWVRREGPEAWSVPPDLRQTLQAVGERDARETAAGKAVWSTAWAGRRDELVAVSPEAGERLVGAYVGAQPLGRHAEGPQVVVLNLADGRLGHLRLPDRRSVLCLDRIPEGAVIEARRSARSERPADLTIAEVASERGGVWSPAEHAAARPGDSAEFIERHRRRLEAMSREGACVSLGDGRFAVPSDYRERALQAEAQKEGSARVDLKVLDQRSLVEQARSPGLTWLDRVMAGRETVEMRGSFGKTVAHVLPERAAWLRSQGLGSGEPLTLGPKDLKALTTLEIRATFEALGQHGKPVFMATTDQSAAGVYMARVHVAGAPFAVLESRSAVTLVPWRPALEACRGQAMVAQVTGGITDFRFGREVGRDLGLG